MSVPIRPPPSSPKPEIKPPGQSPDDNLSFTIPTGRLVRVDVTMTREQYDDLIARIAQAKAAIPIAVREALDRAAKMVESGGYDSATEIATKIRAIGGKP